MATLARFLTGVPNFQPFALCLIIAFKGFSYTYDFISIMQLKGSSQNFSLAPVSQPFYAS